MRTPENVHIGDIGQADTHLPPLAPVVEVYSPAAEDYIRRTWWYKRPTFVRMYGRPESESALLGDPRFMARAPVPPFWGEWGVVRKGSGGHMQACGKIGPFNTQEEAFREAVKLAKKHGAEILPRDGYAQVIDSAGQAVGPII